MDLSAYTCTLKFPFVTRVKALSMNNIRVVITGMGLTGSLGYGVDGSWQRLVAGKSGVSALPADACGDPAIRVGG